MKLRITFSKHMLVYNTKDYKVRSGSLKLSCLLTEMLNILVKRKADDGLLKAYEIGKINVTRAQLVLCILAAQRMW